VIAATEEWALLQNDVIDRPPSRQWGRGLVTLLGDAIHPTTPNFGQGACQALEDAVALAHCLRSVPALQDGLRAYEQCRQRRTAMVTRQSWRLGKVLQWEHPAAVWFRDALASTRWGHYAAAQAFRDLLLHGERGV
jgi:2-polyprenyl-6-methoxyphenol hydroxylase-like FAD-dependent oxidoreductase